MTDQLEHFMAQSRGYQAYVKACDEAFLRFLCLMAPWCSLVVLLNPIHILHDLTIDEDEDGTFKDDSGSFSILYFCFHYIFA